MDTPLAPLHTGECQLALTGQQSLVLSRREDGDLIQFMSAQGVVVLSVEVTSRGPVLRFEGKALTLQIEGDLAIDAESLHLHGRKGVSLSTEGDLTLQARGDLCSEARIQNVAATLCNVNVRANDDVRLNGERVLVNC